MTEQDLESSARYLHAQSIVVDALNTPHPPGAPDFETFVDYVRRGGVTAVHLTMHERTPQGWGWDAVIRALAAWTGRCHRYPDQGLPATSAQHIRTAKKHGKVALIFGLQNAACLEDQIERLEPLYNFGVRLVQLTYNGRNRVGCGCLEQVDDGLNAFGIRVVEQLNQLGILVDISHCGPRTSLDTARASQAPIAALMSEERWTNYHQVRLEGFDSIAGWPNLTRGLVSRGYADDDIGKILGENWLRLFARVWDGQGGE